MPGRRTTVAVASAVAVLLPLGGCGLAYGDKETRTPADPFATDGPIARRDPQADVWASALCATGGSLAAETAEVGRIVGDDIGLILGDQAAQDELADQADEWAATASSFKLVLENAPSDPTYAAPAALLRAQYQDYVTDVEAARVAVEQAFASQTDADVAAANEALRTAADTRQRIGNTINGYRFDESPFQAGFTAAPGCQDEATTSTTEG